MDESQIDVAMKMLEVFGVKSPDNLNDLASILGVSPEQLNSWKSDCPALDECPIDFGKCAIQLLARKHLSPESVIKESKDGQPTSLQIAFASSVLKAGVDSYNLSEVLEIAIATEPKIAELIATNDIEGTKTAIRMSGPFKRKEWKPLSSRDSAVIAITQPKTASLFFDRVWCVDYMVPADIGFRCNTLPEKLALGFLNGVIAMVADAISVSEEKLNKIEKVLDERMDEFETSIAPMQEKLILQPLRQATGLEIRPFLGTQPAARASYEPGQYQVLLPMLESIKVVDESQLQWDQVQEFRKDAKSRHTLMRLLNWLDIDLASKPLKVVEDHLAIQLHDYERALSKHGIRTVMGTLGTVVGDWKSWATATSAWFAGQTVGESGVLTAGLGLTAKIVFDVWTIRTHLGKEMHEPIAYLNAVKKLSN